MAEEKTIDSRGVAKTVAKFLAENGLKTGKTETVYAGPRIEITGCTEEGASCKQFGPQSVVVTWRRPDEKDFLGKEHPVVKERLAALERYLKMAGYFTTEFEFVDGLYCFRVTGKNG